MTTQFNLRECVSCGNSIKSKGYIRDNKDYCESCYQRKFNQSKPKNSKPSSCTLVTSPDIPETSFTYNTFSPDYTIKEMLRAEQDYEAACRENSEQCWKEFLRMYPDSPYTRQVCDGLAMLEKKRLEEERNRKQREEQQRQERAYRQKEQRKRKMEQAYAHSTKEHTEQCYEAFIRNYPESPQLSQVELLLRQLQEKRLEKEHKEKDRLEKECRRKEKLLRAEKDYEAACRTNTEKSYKSFIKNWPSSPQRHEARRSIDRLIRDKQERERQEENTAWQKASTINTPHAYRIFMHSYPTSVKVSEAKKRVEGSKHHQKHKVGDTFVEPITGMEFVWVPEGSFMMGSGEYKYRELGGDWRYEKPIHKVILKGLWLAKYPVTERQWLLVMNTFPRSYESKQPGLKTIKRSSIWYEREDFWLKTMAKTPMLRNKLGSQYPITHVNWDDAQTFISRLNSKANRTFRLPSEAEWEYAARSGGKEHKWSGTSNETDLLKYARFANEVSDDTAPVHERLPNELGLHDMSGNVKEWCQDRWHRDYHGAPFDGSDWVQGGKSVERVCRGGSFKEHATECRTTYRTYYERNDSWRFDTGFRLACSLS